MTRLVNFWNEGSAHLLRKTLEERGVSVERLAELLAVHPRTVRNWLRTDTPPNRPTPQNLVALSRALDLSVDALRSASDSYKPRIGPVLGDDSTPTSNRRAHGPGLSSRILALLRTFYLGGDRRSDMREKFASADKLRVFLCHASQDKAAVRTLHDELMSAGVAPWLDELAILPGQDWEHEIRHALRACHVVLVCLSNHAVAKTGFVQKEIRIALDIADEQPEGSIFIIPARLEPCEVPTRLNRWHWVDLFRDNGKQKLLAALRKRAEELGLDPFSVRGPTLV